MKRISWIVALVTPCLLALAVSVSWAQDEDEGDYEDDCVQDCYDAEEDCYAACESADDFDACEANCQADSSACVEQCD